MKKIYSLLAICAMFFSSTNTSKAQALEEGNVSVDVYYGFGTFTKVIVDAVTDNSTAKASVFGPMGAKFEYMASDKMGVGIDFNYATFTVDWTDSTYNYSFTRNVVRIMPRFNIHFGSSESFDGYFGIAAGYRTATFKSSSNDPNYDASTVSGLNPFAFRIALGGRYFFTDNIGIHMELGLSGGAMIHGGLSFKF